MSVLFFSAAESSSFYLATGQSIGCLHSFRIFSHKVRILKLLRVFGAVTGPFAICDKMVHHHLRRETGSFTVLQMVRKNA